MPEGTVLQSALASRPLEAASFVQSLAAALRVIGANRTWLVVLLRQTGDGARL